MLSALQRAATAQLLAKLPGAIEWEIMLGSASEDLHGALHQVWNRLRLSVCRPLPTCDLGQPTVDCCLTTMKVIIVGGVRSIALESSLRFFCFWRKAALLHILHASCLPQDMSEIAD
jgi:hypothetical protein